MPDPVVDSSFTCPAEKRIGLDRRSQAGNEHDSPAVHPTIKESGSRI